MAEMSGGKVLSPTSLTNGSLPSGSRGPPPSGGQGRTAASFRFPLSSSSSIVSTSLDPVSASSTSGQTTAPPTSILRNNRSGLSRYSLESTRHCGKFLCGVVLMVVSGTCWVGLMELASSAYQWPTFHSPYFVMYFSSFWVTVIYPIFLTGHFITAKGKISIKEIFRECVLIYGSGTEQQLKTLKVVAKVSGFGLLWALGIYLLLRALNFKPCLDIAILFATNSSFDYLLSWILLQRKFVAIKIVSLLLSMAGVCMVAYMEDQSYAGPGMWGVIMAVASSVCAAFFKVLFTRIMGEPTFGQSSFFFTCVGVSHVLTMWPLLLLLYFTKAEPIDWNNVPWGLLCGIGTLGLVFIMIMCFGAAVAYPVILRFNIVLAIPLSAAADVLWRGETFGGTQIGASVLVVVASLCNTLPEDWHDNFLKMIRWKQQDRERQQAEAVMSPRQRLRSSTVC